MSKLLRTAVLVLCCLICLCSCGEKKPEEKISEGEDYVLHTDVSYGDHERHLVDICLPKGKTGYVGLVFFIHGGGWTAGDKDTFDGQLVGWAQQGYAAAALNYRYADGQVTVFNMLDDITRCLGKVKALGASYGMSIERTVIQGGSAGAHLALMYAYTRAEVAPIRPVAVSSLSGPTDLCAPEYFAEGHKYRDPLDHMLSSVIGYDLDMSSPEAAIPFLKQSSPTSYAEDGVPTIICHGAHDDLIPLSNAYTLAEKLSEAKIPHELLIFPSSGHGLESDPDLSARSGELFRQYVDKYLNGEE